MTPEQKDIVKRTWTSVVPIADSAADLFYQKLFELDPALEPLFAGVDLAAQKKKLLQALAATVAGLDRTAADLLLRIGCSPSIADHETAVRRRRSGCPEKDTLGPGLGCGPLQHGLDDDRVDSSRSLQELGRRPMLLLRANHDRMRHGMKHQRYDAERCTWTACNSDG